jgi:hypothetical protein
MSVRFLWFFQLAVFGQLFSPVVRAETITSWNEIAQETIVSSDQHDEVRARAGTGPSTVDVIPRRSSLEGDKFEIEGISEWLRARFNPSELEALQAGDLTVELHLCGCYDKPKRHFPYRMVVIKTPKGDLVARPENREVSVSFTALAVRRGNTYCDVDAETSCFGSFSDACDFSDFRYGPYLSIFFPTCMLEETESIAQTWMLRASIEETGAGDIF